MIDEALTLAAQGVAIFPCSADKSPRTPNGFKDASTDEATLRGWDWKDALIGAAIPEGTVVVDCDPRNGGSDTLKALRGAGRKLPATRVAQTGGGGFHYYLRVPPGAVLRSSLGPGIDVKRAGKGYVITPPSAGYRWHGSKDVADAPEWLLEELVVVESARQAGTASEPKFFDRFEQGTAYGLAAMERELGRLAAAPEGERNNALNRAAFALSQLAAGGELSEERARAELGRVGERVGLDAHEIEGTVASGWSAGELEPRQAPEKAEAIVRLADRTFAGGEEAESGGSVLPAPPAELWVNWEVDEPELPFYLHPVLPKNAYVLVYGATEAAKSMTWHAIGAEASTRGYRVTVYSLENPAHVDRDRLRRLRPNPENFRLTNEPLDFNDPRQLAELVEREKAWGTDILIVDTYSHAFNSRSEDGNEKAIEFARRVRHVMHEVGCSVVLLDHTGYQQTDEPRDASAKRQQVDVAVLMTKVGEWKPGGQPARFRMVNKKAARFANPFDFTGEIRDVEVGEAKGLEIGWLHGKRPEWK